MSDTTISPAAAGGGGGGGMEECVDCQPDKLDHSGNSNQVKLAQGGQETRAKGEDLMDASTFVAPLTATTGLPTPLVVIEVSSFPSTFAFQAWF